MLGMTRPVQIAIIVVGLAAVVLLFSVILRPEVPLGHIPEDFPHPWLARGDAGHPEKLVLLRGRQEPVPPCTRDGVELWFAWRCLAPGCAGRQGDQGWVFPGGYTVQCPRCGARMEDGKLDRAYDAEGEAAVARIRGGAK